MSKVYTSEFKGSGCRSMMLGLRPVLKQFTFVTKDEGLNPAPASIPASFLNRFKACYGAA